MKGSWNFAHKNKDGWNDRGGRKKGWSTCHQTGTSNINLCQMGRLNPNFFTFQVKPLLSLDADEARVRVLSLYRAWYRQIPMMLETFDLPVNEQQLKDKLKEKFMENAHLKDIRVIDMKVIQVGPANKIGSFVQPASISGPTRFERSRGELARTLHLFIQIL